MKNDKLEDLLEDLKELQTNTSDKADVKSMLQRIVKEDPGFRALYNSLGNSNGQADLDNKEILKQLSEHAKKWVSQKNIYNATYGIETTLKDAMLKASPLELYFLEKYEETIHKNLTERIYKQVDLIKESDFLFKRYGEMLSGPDIEINKQTELEIN